LATLVPIGLKILVGFATVPDSYHPVPVPEHDERSWRPRDIDRWPGEADERLSAMAAVEENSFIERGIDTHDDCRSLTRIAGAPNGADLSPTDERISGDART
jgi:hypothetical protein